MNDNIYALQARIEPFRQEIINHKVYSVIKDIDDLKIFMQYHVFAVWDFMSLLKSLQNSLTCTTVPWFPIGSADTRYLINEIVVGEESDVDLHGVRKSHFELYQDAMQQVGADMSAIQTFVSSLSTNHNFDDAFKNANAPIEVKEFVNFTFDVIKSDKNHLKSAVFTFGREDLIPSMFRSIVDDINKTFPDNISTFKYYLDRHIEVDGDNHSHLALQMTANLCEQNDQFWEEAEAATIQSLQMRINLWNGIYNSILKRKNNIPELA
jgi:hypothetical protein